jgi:dTDP-4-dehydrorhamnose reductase
VLELWAGAECSVVRVGDAWIDQLARTGHADRAGDLDRLAALGVRAFRQPVLWERTAPGDVARADWRWADERLARLRALGVRPIVGLVHHGSGPRGACLVDAAFAEGLARLARAAAERYPWVEDWTPVNEPLTTARFAALYGHWYPHARSDGAFTRALLVQCAAVAASMRAIREVNPRARLVQTEDFGTTFATPHLAYQARFENARRFLSLDLLFGRVDRTHPMRGWLVDAGGATDGQLDRLAAEPCPPDVVGVNYYVTSDRFLDERVDRYPAHARGGNGREAYADVEAARVRARGILGHHALLALLWRRYRAPLAVTEAHLGGPPEQQIRWLAEAWAAARRAREEGIAVRAVTAWSAFGAYDWDSLLVRDRGHYEPGLYDARTAPPRPTALARVARELGARGESSHPLLGAGGWWTQPSRLAYPAAGPSPAAPSRREPAPVLLAGASGTLGQAFQRACRERGVRLVALPRRALDVTDGVALARALDALRPWALVNAAGYVRVDDAEREADRCWRVNALAPALAAAACDARGVRFLTFSSDLVFDGAAGRPYVESDRASPLGVYGATKAEAEERVLAAHRSAAVVRTSAFFGPWDDSNFVTTTLRAIERGLRVRVAADVVVSPTYVPDLAHAALTLLVDGASGVWHLANRGAISWADFAREVAGRAGVDATRLVPCRAADLGLVARRPSFSALASDRSALMPPLEDALDRYARDVRARRAAGSERPPVQRAGPGRAGPVRARPLAEPEDEARADGDRARIDE